MGDSSEGRAPVNNSICDFKTGGCGFESRPLRPILGENNG